MQRKTKNIIQEISKIEELVLDVKKEIKILRKRVGAYKGWLTRYRKQREELKRETSLLKIEKNRLQKELSLQKKELLSSIKQGKKAKEERDRAIAELDKIIDKIELFKEVCEKANKISYADKIYLIKEAEKLFFEEDSIIIEKELINNKDYPQMFTDSTSINRSLLDR